MYLNILDGNCFGVNQWCNLKNECVQPKRKKQHNQFENVQLFRSTNNHSYVLDSNSGNVYLVVFHHLNFLSWVQRTAEKIVIKEFNIVDEVNKMKSEY